MSNMCYRFVKWRHKTFEKGSDDADVHIKGSKRNESPAQTVKWSQLKYQTMLWAKAVSRSDQSIFPLQVSTTITSNNIGKMLNIWTLWTLSTTKSQHCKNWVQQNQKQALTTTNTTLDKPSWGQNCPDTLEGQSCKTSVHLRKSLTSQQLAEAVFVPDPMFWTVVK